MANLTEKQKTHMIKLHAVQQEWYKSLPKEEKEAYNAKRAAGIKKKGHWTTRSTPEQLQAWKDKMKKGQTKFFTDRKKGKGRPKKFNYKKGWDPSKKSAASKAQWVYRKQYQPEILQRFIEGGHRAMIERCKKIQPLKEEARWAKENGIKTDLEAEYNKERERLFEITKSVLADTGIEPEKNMPHEYYKEIINFFRPGTV